MRSLVYSLLSADPVFMGLVPGGLHGDRALDEVPPLRPFAVLMHEGPNPVPNSGFRLAQVRTNLWIHDEVGDYTRIDTALKLAREIVLSSVPTMRSGIWLINAEWLGDSPDLSDDVRGTNTKNAAFLLTGSGL